MLSIVTFDVSATSPSIPEEEDEEEEEEEEAPATVTIEMLDWSAAEVWEAEEVDFMEAEMTRGTGRRGCGDTT